MMLTGDCRDVMQLCMGENEVDSIVTDPPYDLTSKRPGGRSPATEGAVMKGFMGMQWDGSGVAFDPATWREALRVLKPGGYLLAFGGTRTYHRMVCAIEDAGFEIRDQIGWVYGSGFPKSRNGEWGGTALKPAWEPIVLARKPLIGTVEANWFAHGTGTLNIDRCRVEHVTVDDGNLALNPHLRETINGGNGGRIIAHEEERRVVVPDPLGRWPANIIHDGSDEVLAAFPQAVGQIADASSSSSSRKTQNVYGDMKKGNGREGEPSADDENEGSVGFKMKPGARRADAGSAARFFYCAKASRKDRNDGCEHMEKQALNWSAGTQNPGSFQSEGTDRSAHNHHPTVKPTELMRYLCRLVTPSGGTVFDPFAGSGSTGRGAKLEGFAFIGIEREPQYVAIAEARIAACR